MAARRSGGAKRTAKRTAAGGGGARVERDTLGPVRVPAHAYWGAQTQRAADNFPISGMRLPPRFVWAQGVIKRSAALANMEEKQLAARKGRAIVRAADEVIAGRWNDHFIVDVYQAGAGTSQNMNANEVIANRANELLGGRRGAYDRVHPNDDVNASQSTNDTIHVAIHLAALAEVRATLRPALRRFEAALARKAKAFARIVKSGRTHLMDATPITLGQEFGGWADMARLARERVEDAAAHLEEIHFGGTAVGTGINATPGYSKRAIRHAAKATGFRLRPARDFFREMQNVEAETHVSAAVRNAAVSVAKVAGDIRLLGSGPRTGFAELVLPAVQPGSSIMPGKVNPSMAEMVNQVCYQVYGNDTTVWTAATGAQLELNVMMPVVAWNLLHEVRILGNALDAFTERCVVGIQADRRRCATLVEWSTAIATALAPRLGYHRAAELAKEAFRDGVTVRDLVVRKGLLSAKEAAQVLDPLVLTRPGVFE